jgi:hypothetical protein
MVGRPHASYNRYKFTKLLSPITQSHKSEVPKWVQRQEALYCYVCVSLVKGWQNCIIQRFVCWVLIILKSQLLTNVSGTLKWGTGRYGRKNTRRVCLCVCVCVERPASSYMLQTEGNQCLEMGNKTYQGRLQVYATVQLRSSVFWGIMWVHCLLPSRTMQYPRRVETSKITKMKSTVHRGL